jgi:hypothetical protein
MRWRQAQPTTADLVHRYLIFIFSIQASIDTGGKSSCLAALFQENKRLA